MFAGLAAAVLPLIASCSGKAECLRVDLLPGESKSLERYLALNLPDHVEIIDGRTKTLYKLPWAEEEIGKPIKVRNSPIEVTFEPGHKILVSKDCSTSTPTQRKPIVA